MSRARRCAPEAVFELGVPILGICYGEQLLCANSAARLPRRSTASSAAPWST